MGGRAGDSNPYAAPVHTEPEALSSDLSQLPRELRTTRLGFLLINYGIMGVLSFAAISILLGTAITEMQVVSMSRFAFFAIVASSLVYFGGLLTAVFGHLLLLFTPWQTGARLPVILSFILQLASVIGWTAFDLYFLRGDETWGRFRLLFLLSAFLGQGCFLWFLLRLAKYMQRDDLVDRTQTLVKLWGVLGCLCLSISGFALAQTIFFEYPVFDQFKIVIVLIGMIFGLAFFAFFTLVLNLIHQFQRGIKTPLKPLRMPLIDPR